MKLVTVHLGIILTQSNGRFKIMEVNLTLNLTGAYRLQEGDRFIRSGKRERLNKVNIKSRDEKIP